MTYNFSSSIMRQPDQVSVDDICAICGNNELFKNVQILMKRELSGRSKSKSIKRFNRWYEQVQRVLKTYPCVPPILRKEAAGETLSNGEVLILSSLYKKIYGRLDEELQVCVQTKQESIHLLFEKLLDFIGLSPLYQSEIVHNIAMQHLSDRNMIRPYLTWITEQVTENHIHHPRHLVTVVVMAVMKFQYHDIGFQRLETAAFFWNLDELTAYVYEYFPHQPGLVFRPTRTSIPTPKPSVRSRSENGLSHLKTLN